MPHIENTVPERETTCERIERHSKELWDRLSKRGAAPTKNLEDRPLRSFSLGEVAEILGVSGSYLRQLSIDGLGPTPELGTAGRRSYTLQQINELRAYLASSRSKEALKFCPRRREGEKLQIILVAAGPATTTTSLYLTQGLALQGFRVLAVDLDPRGSLSEMFGYFTATYPVLNASMFAAISYDDRLSMSSIIQKTHFDGLDFVPGSYELEIFERESSKRYRSKLGYPDASIQIVNALRQVEEDYDIVVIHCGPESGSFVTAGAFEAATGVLVTVRPQLVEIAKTAMSLRLVSHFVSLIGNAGRPVNYDFIKYLVTRHNPRDVSQQEAVALLRDSLKDDLLTAMVWESDAIREAGFQHRSLYELSAGVVGRSAYEQAMETMTSMNAEVMDLILKAWGRRPMYVSRAARSSTAG
ncbi:chromosome partitioning protein [Rhizobium pisi]